MKLLSNYKNGNYTVQLYDDGTKIRILDDGETEYKPKFPENIDCCISKKCSIGCAFCYADCTPKGNEFVPDYYKNKEFLDSLQPGMEIAIGGGALSEVNPSKFRDFIITLHEKNIFPSITINAKELLKEEFRSKFLNKFFIEAYLYGIGISYNAFEECKDAMLRMKRMFPKRVVIHTILGVTTPEDYQWLADNHFKVLVLGYKMKGRGLTYCSEKDKSNREWAVENLLNLRNKFKTLSFDCLAVKQMDLQNKVNEETWQKYYMGDDGQFTMYVDMVECKFAESSSIRDTEYRSYYFNFCGNNISNMFKFIRTEYYKNKNKKEV